jgi:hypothetical protein
MTVGKIRTLTSAGLLLISMQICLAAQQQRKPSKFCGVPMAKRQSKK